MSKVLFVDPMYWPDATIFCFGLNKRVALTWLLSSCFLLSDLSAKEWFVSPTKGNDLWSGTLKEPNMRRTDGPFRTISRAQRAVRSAHGPRKVLLRGGRYFLPNGLIFTREDSGSSRSPVIWQAFPGERPRLLGGRLIRNWRKLKHNVWISELEKSQIPSGGVSQLFVNGRRENLARYPNFDLLDPIRGGWSYVDGERVDKNKDLPKDRKDRVRVKAEDWKFRRNPEEVRVVIFPRYNWWNDLLYVKSLAPHSRTILLRNSASHAVRPGDRYYLEGAREDLDALGEWYFDRRDQKLIYLSIFSPDKTEALVPMAPWVITMSDGARFIHLKGITVECGVMGGIKLENTFDSRIQDCIIQNVGGYRGSGILISNGKRNLVESCRVRFTGSNGIEISGGKVKMLEASDHRVQNCRISDVGLQYKQGAGVRISGVGQQILNCEISRAPRFAIRFNGNKHVIEYNYIHEVGLETEDVGAIYCSGHNWYSQSGCIIRFNYIRGVRGFGWDGKEWRSPFMAWGIYLDDCSAGVTVFGNVVSECERGAFHGHNIRECRVTNNIFTNNGSYQWQLTGWNVQDNVWKQLLPELQRGYNSVAFLDRWRNMKGVQPAPKKSADAKGNLMAGNVFSTNIISWKDDAQSALKVRCFNGSTNYVGSNIYWPPNGKISVEIDDVLTNWTAWNALGGDVNSFVGDPLFVDFAGGNLNLRPDSPATSLGFQPIPFEKIGPQRK